MQQSTPQTHELAPSAKLTVHVAEARRVGKSDGRTVSNNEQLVIHNTGPVAAEQLQVTLARDRSVDGRLPRLLTKQAIRSLLPGTTERLPMEGVLAGADQWFVVLSWQEGERRFHERYAITAVEDPPRGKPTLSLNRRRPSTATARRGDRPSPEPPCSGWSR
jgi:hypothetical protein